MLFLTHTPFTFRRNTTNTNDKGICIFLFITYVFWGLWWVLKCGELETDFKLGVRIFRMWWKSTSPKKPLWQHWQSRCDVVSLRTWQEVSGVGGFVARSKYIEQQWQRQWGSSVVCCQEAMVQSSDGKSVLYWSWVLVRLLIHLMSK